MNLSEIEKFAVRARRNMTAGVKAALSALDMSEAPMQVQGGWLHHGSPIADIEFGPRWHRLKEIIEREGEKVAIERAAYTWFNRLVAIRILAKRGLVPPQLEWADSAARVPRIVHRMRTGAGTPNLTPGEDAALSRVRSDPTKTREQFAILVGAFCRETPMLSKAFGEIDDWTFLLVPGNLLAENGLVDDLNNSELLSDADYASDELIGWLYQYYISERKAEVYDGFKKNQKAGVAEIPAATQIFTPNWIVKYLVENTLKDDNENAKFIDPCCGSGHILLEAFRRLLAVYDDLGYSKRDAITQIFERNITGIDIDPRARQLSAFALLLAATKEDESFADAHVMPRVYDTALVVGENITEGRIANALDTTNKAAIGEINAALAQLRERGDTVGSLLKLEISPETRALVETRLGDVEDEGLRRALALAIAITARYDALVTNPPYLSSDKINMEVKEYLKTNYKKGKDDLFAAFMLFASSHVVDRGRWGMITMQSWMFLSSFEPLRCDLLDTEQIVGLIHNGYGVFGSDYGSVTFVMEKSKPYFKGEYYRLVDVRNGADKELLFKKLCKLGQAFRVDSREFKKIPGSPIAYWVGEKTIKAFACKAIKDYFDSSVGLQTGDNDKFIRFWFEVSFSGINFGARTLKDTYQSRKYFPYNKGGPYRKWIGNDDSVVDWRNDGENIKANAKTTGHHWQQYADGLKFKELITWSRISAGKIAFRYKPFGYMSDMSGFSLFANGNMSLTYLLGFANSHVAQSFLDFLSPTVNYMLGPVNALPIAEDGKLISSVEANVAALIDLSRSDWDEYETSWNFKVNPLVREGWQRNGSTMSLETAWSAVFARRMEWATRMKELEEENNRLFIKAYGLEDELKPDVAWKDVSIKGNPYYRYGEVKFEGETLKIEGGVTDYTDEALDSTALYGVQKGEALCVDSLKSKARADAMREMLSYGMGILMGRYSLEQEGLILASQGELYKDYIARVHGAGKVLPDEDGVIPAIALEGGFFRDNLLHRMREFLSAAFGNDALPGNLNFIEEALGCGFDKYLTDKFFDDHVKTYRKRPIYWLFESPKGYFRAFAYMHRMTGATAGHIRNNYLLPYIAHLEKCFAVESAKGAAMTSAERKRVKAMEAAIKDCKAYDNVLHDVAEKSIAIDLDDGVVANWAKYKSVLAKI